jgi:uncharacterized protein YdeI (YjbR/CyaY-like superfamily)
MTTQILSLKSSSEWEAWLESNHATSDGVWLRIFRKDSGKPIIGYLEAVERALCYGWIDGQSKSLDPTSWIQKFTPRRPKSVWSKINTERAERLLKEGKMKPAGVAAVEAAKQDGRWGAAYDPPSKAVIPKEFLQALAKDRKAKAFFDTLNRTNLYSIAWRLQTAKKPETRARRMEAILKILARGKKFH